MANPVNLWPLIGVAVIIAGFVLRFNPMLIVAAAAIITGIAAHFPVEKLLTAIGSGFLKTRNIPLIILLPLAVIGLLGATRPARARADVDFEHQGRDGRTPAHRLSVRARNYGGGRADGPGRPSADGAPAARADGRRRYRSALRQAVRRGALQAAGLLGGADNVGLFFGEDIFVAFGAIVLMTTFLKEAGIVVEPMHVAVWGIPTAICAFPDPRLPALAARPQARARTRRAHAQRCEREGMTLTINYLFYLVGIVLVIVAGMILTDKSHPRRLSAGGFWLIYALIFLIGDWLPVTVVGVLVVAMALIAGFGGVTGAKPKMLSEETRLQSAVRLGNKLFVPALTIPVVTVVLMLGAKYLVIGGTPLIEMKNVTLIGFGIGCVIALAIACVMTRDIVGQSMRETRRLIDALSWAAVLLQMLGMLGLVFSDAGVGKAVAHVTTAYVNMDYRLVAVTVYVVGIALFTMVMGNGFAAFPVMTGGVGVPILVGIFHGNPATMAAIGMFSGYCGTLMTPMAANFNIVPAALLELPDKNAVIRVQVPTALTLLVANIFLLNW
ncbi:Membrane protein [Candidatus Paraburkholderia schumanniana]|nr:Membrane protein [Candidatus Paraburkholderia schumannianae]